MRKIELTDMENNRYEVIKRLVETKGNKKRAAQTLGVTVRTINRLIKKYKTEGKFGFSHGNHYKTPSIKISELRKNTIIDLYMNKYYGTNFTHFCDLLKRFEGITVSRSTVSTWFKSKDILSPKAHNRTKRKLKKELKLRKSVAKTNKEKVEINVKLESIDARDAHPTQSRPAYRGESVQMDASSFKWFTDEVIHLHVAIDDADGKIVGAYFDYQETLYGYQNVLLQILTNHGIPAKFKVDYRSVFEYKRKSAPNDYEDTYTQFGYACSRLGIEIEASSIPQTKGRVERLNQTLQSRLPAELKLAGVTTIEEANKFLHSYIKEFNAKFSIPINSTKSVYEKQPEPEQINTILAVLTNRKIDSGHSIKFKNKVYQPYSQSGIPAYFPKGTSALVIESFDKQLFVNVLDQLFIMVEVPERKEFSELFDQEVPKITRKYHIPPMSHPWKQASYNQYLSKQKHRIEIDA